MAESLESGKIAERARQQEYFRLIGQECRRLSSLIENVLDFSRIEQGRKQYEFEPTDLVALARQTLKLMEISATERQIDLALAIAEPDIQTLSTRPVVDGKAIQQALVNLIDNAMKHSPKGQTVTVGLELRETKEPAGRQKAEGRRQKGQASSSILHSCAILLWVEDHGDGIPREDHQRIFERFYRRGSELRRQTQGVGIGLSIVKHIVEAHGGQVLVRSAVGQGSRFTIELPLWNEC
jgi:signal transduction histidine kinase